MTSLPVVRGSGPLDDLSGGPLPDPSTQPGGRGDGGSEPLHAAPTPPGGAGQRERGGTPAGLRSPGDYPGLPGGVDFGLPPDVERLWSALREVRDPELPVSLVDLGLIYDVRLAAGVAQVDMTFTATGCPCMEFMKMDVEERLLAEGGVASVEIREVWSPPWRRERMTAQARGVLKRFGVAA